MRMLPFAVLGALLAGCAERGAIDLSRIPPGEYGPMVDVDDAALYDASLAFSSEHGVDTPQKIAHALAAVEYLAGAYNGSARWLGFDGIAQIRILQARDEIRQVLAVSPGTRSQAVVDTLLAASRTVDDTAFRRALTSPILTLGPDQTAAILTHHPALPQTVQALTAVRRGIYFWQLGPGRGPERIIRN
jgi:hypothetical protein